MDEKFLAETKPADSKRKFQITDQIKHINPVYISSWTIFITALYLKMNQHIKENRHKTSPKEH